MIYTSRSKGSEMEMSRFKQVSNLLLQNAENSLADIKIYFFEIRKIST